MPLSDANIPNPAAKPIRTVAPRGGLVSMPGSLHRDRAFQRRDQRAAADGLTDHATSLRPGIAKPERTYVGSFVGPCGWPLCLPRNSGVDPWSPADTDRPLPRRGIEQPGL